MYLRCCMAKSDTFATEAAVAKHGPELKRRRHGADTGEHRIRAHSHRLRLPSRLTGDFQMIGIYSVFPHHED